MTIYSNGDKTAYGIKHYDLDTIEDIENAIATASV